MYDKHNSINVLTCHVELYLFPFRLQEIYMKVLLKLVMMEHL